MSYDAKEISNYEAVPITLYEFRLGAKYWRYTTFELPVVAPTSAGGTATYEAVPISDGGITQSGDINNDDMVITLPKEADVMRPWIGTPPSQETYLTVRAKDANDSEAKVVWVGTVANAQIKKAGVAEMVCKMLTSSFNRNGARQMWTRGCQAALYDDRCRVNKNDFAVSFTVTDVTGEALSGVAIGALPDGWFSGGFVEWDTVDGVKARRMIERHSSVTIFLMGTPDDVTVGQVLVAYPGCLRTTLICETKFNNLANYRGYPHMPGKSPFDGDPVF